MEHIIKNAITGETTVVPFTEAEIAEYKARSIYIPPVVKMRQARLALLQSGHLATVNAAIAGMPSIEGEAARIEWEFAETVERGSSLVQAMAAALSLTEAQLDDLFTMAGGL